MKKIILQLFLIVLFSHMLLSQEMERVSIGKDIGQVKDIDIRVRVVDEITAESLVGATIIIEELNLVESTNVNGTVEFKLDRAEYTLKVSYLGYGSITIPITAIGDGRLTVRLLEEGIQLDNITIYGRDPDRNIRSTDMGAVSISMAAIKELPPFMGEIDIIKAMTTLPGVSQVGEASAGFNVRGGGPDQNLIMFAGAPIYNPSHLFGLFTAFNPSSIRNVTLYKAVIPAKFGGRGSSILDISAKKGNFGGWSADGILGTFSSSVNVEGPIIKDKLSLYMGGRMSYVNWMLKSITSNPELRNSRANFYDLNGTLSYAINNNNIVSYSFYDSYDDFSFSADNNVEWANRSHSLKWEATFSSKLEADIVAYHTDYDYTLLDSAGFNNFSINSGVQDQGIKGFLLYKLNDKHTLTFGGDTKWLSVNPGERIPDLESGSAILPKTVQSEQANESAIHFQHEFDISSNIAISYGARYNMYRYLGPRRVNEYEPFRPLNTGSIINTIEYGSGDVIASYNGFAPRASLRLTTGPKSSLKIGYNKMFQFMHLISNTATIAPTDFWKMADQYFLPQEVDQYSIGLYKNLKGNIYETSIEAYYKDIRNVIEYKDGAELILQDNLETQLVPGTGRAYGVELFLRKNVGRLTGWVGYTYSRSLRRVISPFEEEIINNGDWFASNFDKPHDINVIGNYKFNTYLTFSANFNYSTGRPVTLPEAKYNFGSRELAFFDQRNLGRIPDFHRLDVSMTIDTKSKKKLLSGELTLSILNVYGRRNPFSIFFANKERILPQAFRLSIIGVPVPTISYSLKI